MGMFSIVIENKFPPWPVFLMFVVSQSPSHVFLDKMELTLLLDLTRPYNKIPSTKFRLSVELQTNVVYKIPCAIVFGVTLVRLEGVFKEEKRNTLEMQKSVKLAQIMQLALGVIITLLTSIKPE